MKKGISGFCSRMISYAFLLSLGITIGVIPDTWAQPTIQSRYCEWFPVGLPTGIDEFESYALSREGMLFVATKDQVFVRDSVEPTGWRVVYTLPTREDGLEDHIQSIAAAPFRTELVNEAVYVFSDFGAWAISWLRAKVDQAPWSGLRYNFNTIAMELPDGFTPKTIFPLNSLAKFGLVADSSGDIAVVSATGTKTQIEIIDSLVDVRESFIVNGIGGTVIAWGYRSNTAYILNPEAPDHTKHRIDRIELPKQSGVDGDTTINEIVIVPERNLLAIASSNGLYLGHLNPKTGGLQGELLHVEAFENRELKWVGTYLGRIAIAAEGLKKGEIEGALAIETSSGAPADLENLQFELPAGGPTTIHQVKALAPDVLLIQDWQSLYEYHPNGWTRLDDPFGVLNDLSLFKSTSSHAGISIFSNLLEKKLYGCRARSENWKFFELAKVSSLAHLVPDPSGLGAWLIELPPVGVGGNAGYIRFLSPHGYSNTAESVTYGQHHELRRVRLVGSDRTVSWPESELGGMIFPTGSHFLWGNAGRWKTFSLPDGTPPFTSLTPAGESGTRGWLGIIKGLPHRVVRIDVSGSHGYPDSLTMKQTEVVCDGEDSALVPDNDRHVWLACLKNKTWNFKRIHAIVETADFEMTASNLPEQPVWLLKLDTNGWILTETGIMQIDGLGWSRFADGLAANSQSILAQIVAEHNAKGAATWRALWKNENGGKKVFAFEVFPAPDAQTSRTRVIVRTHSHHSIPTEWSPGPAFSLDLAGGEPTIRMYSNGDEALLSTEPASATEAAYDIASDAGGTHLRYQSGGDISLPALDYASVSTRYIPSEFFHSPQPAPPSFVIVANSYRAAIRLNSSIETPGNVHPIIPVSLTYRDIQGIDRGIELHTPLPTTSLPAPDGPVTVRFTSTPEDWWHPSLPAVRLRTDSQSEWTELAEGVARMRPRAGTTSHFQFEIQKRDGSWSNEFTDLPITFEALPNPIPRWLIALLAASGIAIVFLASRRIQEKILIILGRRWAIQTGESDHVVTVRDNGNHRIFIRTRGSTPTPVNHSLQFVAADKFVLPYLKPGENVRLEVEGNGLFIERPWSNAIGSYWSRGHEAIIAGQIAVLPATPTDAEFARNGRPQKAIRFTALGYSPREKTHLGPQGHRYSPLPGLAGELEYVRNIFAKRYADTSINHNADEKALMAALRESDIVHVVAHAEHDRIYLANGTSFTSSDLASLDSSELRCRLIVLSVCHAGSIMNPQASLAFQFVKRGVNMIASTKSLDYIMAKHFFGDLYLAWLPKNRKSGKHLASAIRTSVENSTANRNDLEKLDVLVLYGDPTLHLVFK